MSPVGELAVRQEELLMFKRTIAGTGLFIAAVTAAWIVADPTSAQTERRGPGYGPGMMYGQGYGPGMMGQGYPGMMYGRGYGRRGFGYGPGMMGGCPMLGTGGESRGSTFAEGRIAFLKAELNIVAAQETAWNAYAEAIKRNLQNMQGMWQSMRAVFEADTPVERLDAQVAAMEGRLAALKEVRPALADLYAALNADQKDKADELLTGMGCMM
jgi:hypothetical protein